MEQLLQTEFGNWLTKFMKREIDVCYDAARGRYRDNYKNDRSYAECVRRRLKSAPFLLNKCLGVTGRLSQLLV